MREPEEAPQAPEDREATLGVRGSKEQRWARGEGKLQTPEPTACSGGRRTSVTAMMGDRGSALEKPFESEWKELRFQALS